MTTDAKDLASRPEDVAQLEAIALTMREGFHTVEEMTRSFIREAIVRGVFRPGARLQQDSVAAFLGVSRMPVRASLRQLEAEGFVAFHRHRGATVKTLSAAQVAELFELRILLERHAVSLAIPRLTGEAIDELDRLAEELEREPEGSTWSDRRQAFYRRLYSYAQRPETVGIIMRLREQIGPYLLLKRVVEESPGHQLIIDFLRDRDVAGAQEWIASHLARVSAELQQLVATELDEDE